MVLLIGWVYLLSYIYHQPLTESQNSKICSERPSGAIDDLLRILPDQILVQALTSSFICDARWLYDFMSGGFTRRELYIISPPEIFKQPRMEEP